MEKISVKFLGAAGTVIGSKYLISARGKNILIDCGMFQGLKKLRLLNWENLPVSVPGIDLVLLTHGHLDHTGYLPRLVNSGFKGKIMATSPTLQIAEIILNDSARIQEEDSQFFYQELQKTTELFPYWIGGQVIEPKEQKTQISPPYTFPQARFAGTAS